MKRVIIIAEAGVNHNGDILSFKHSKQSYVFLKMQ